jgi:hypothetical protein
MNTTPGWIRFAVIGMVCVALSSGLQPWIDAVSGAFVPADIAQDSAAVRLFVNRIDPYGPIVREAHAKLLDVPLEGTFPHFPHPPFSLLVSLPLAFGPFELSAGLWFGFTLALSLVLAALLAVDPSRSRGGAAPLSPSVWQMWLLLLLWPPVLYNLEKGQWSVLLAVLLGLAWHAVARSNVRAAAAWAGAAAAIKVFPVILGGYFLIRSSRGTVWFGATGFVLTALPLLWIGPNAFAGFVSESRLNMPYWESFPSVMFSIHGALARLFVGGQWAEPLVHMPKIAVLVEVIIVTVLLGTAGWISLRARRGEVDHELSFVSWIVLLPMLNPQSLGHNGVILAVPIVVILRRLTQSGLQWQRRVWAVAVVLVSLPKQTVWRLAPPPLAPLEGLVVVGLPTWGSLILFGVVVSIALSEAQSRRSGTDAVGASPRLSIA